MLVVAARVDADAAATGLALRATTATSGTNPAAANAAGARLLTGSAVFGIGGEVAAAVDSAAILDTNGAVCALADPAPALDRNEVTLAHLAARATVVQIGLEIDADAGAVGKPRLTCRSVALRGGNTSRAAADDGHGGQESECPPA
jgi:hypothetical protein